MIQSNPDKSWKLEIFCSNPNMNFDRYIANKLNIYQISYNKSITWKNVVNNIDNIDWNFHLLAQNKFDRFNSSQKIQHIFRHWRSKTRVQACTLLLSDPEFLSSLLPLEICHHIPKLI